MDWNLKLVQTFLLVARHRSFSRAADAAMRSQPTISGQVAELEKQLGFKLFERSTRTVTLTREGARMMESAERALNELSVTYENIRRTSAAAREHVSITCLPTLSCGILPRILHDFQAANRSISVSVRELNNEDLYACVLSHEADIGIGVQLDTPGLTYQPLGDEEMLAIVSPDNPFYGAEEVSMAALLDFSLLILPQATPTITAFERLARERQSVTELLQRFSQPETVLRMSLTGVGVGLLPSSYIDVQDLDPRSVLRLTAPGLRRPLAILTSNRLSMTRPMEKLTRLIASRIGTGAEEAYPIR
jgi:DNA-binding transcriptional LysR family regulator